ncbi:hypothetical protein EDD18DRAFT_1109069 [Armillaria luteobubalina]|uniref:Transmembrane protein n=1 Tax=Armillaria luteobubalina TaxID=153913 RepID=A0AA39PZ00_9AGAR|nr:hypothetical protein EDD18DRAFT_1109069 [Armillaria luteobubalina]
MSYGPTEMLSFSQESIPIEFTTSFLTSVPPPSTSFTVFSTFSTTLEATMSPLDSTDRGGAEVTVTATQKNNISPSVSLQTSSSSTANNNSSCKKTSPATIAGSTIGSLAAVLVLALLFILWRRRHNSRVGSNADEEIGDPETGTVPNSNPILPSSSDSVRTVSISTISSLTSDLPRRLSQSSRHAYEEEIERLRQEVLSLKNHIRYIHQQTELTPSSSPAPSYHSRRSDASDPFVSSSTLPPTREIPY